MTPQGLAYICRNLVIRETNATTESLTELRPQIDKLDDELLELLAGVCASRAISGSTRKSTTCPCCRRSATGTADPAADWAVRMGIIGIHACSVLQAIHEESIRQQMAVLGE